jgi:hypothetical protein
MPKQRSWSGWLLVIGSILWVMGVNAVTTSEWGPPGTVAYERYQWANRLVALPLLLFLSGNIAIHRSVSMGSDRFGGITLAIMSLGYIAMIVGSVAEFWLFSKRSYTDPFRNGSWTIFLIGIPVLFIGMTLHGIAMWRYRHYPRWLALITILVPIAAVAGLVFVKPTNPIFVMGLSVWAIVLGVWYLWITHTSRQQRASHV